MGGQREAYDGNKKLEVIQWIIDHADGVPTRAAKVFKLPASTVRAWWQQRKDIIGAKPLELRRKRLTGGGRKGVFTKFDDEMCTVITNLRDAKEPITRERVKTLALQIADREGITNFKASDGWLTKFMDRHNISFRHGVFV